MKRTNFAIVSTVALLMVGGYFLLLTPAEGQEQDPPDVFLPVDASGWVDPLLPDDAILRSRPVTVNMATIWLVVPSDPHAADPPPAVPISFNLFEDISVTVVFHKAKPRYDIQIPDNPMDLLGQEFEPVGYTWSGDIVGEHQGYAVMVSKGEVCIANIYVAGEGWFKLRSSETGHVIREISGTSTIECGVQAESSAEGGAAAGSGGGCGIDAAGCDDGSVIDVLAVYTPAAKAQAIALSRDIEMEIDAAVADANAAYGNSEINTTLRLVYKAEIDFTEVPPSGNYGPLTEQWDGELDEVHRFRNALRADQVTLMIKNLGGPSVANIMYDESPGFENEGFSVVNWLYAGATLNVFAHELGHNMGCRHHRDDVGCAGSGPCSFNFGYYFDILGKDYVTIMATVTGQRIPNFSNPDVEYCVPSVPWEVCEPTGIPAGSCGAAHNALRINNTRDTVANFRQSCDTTDTTSRVSHDFFNGEGNAGSREVSLSHNGQYMAFTSDADNFHVTNGWTDIFIYNRESGLVSPVTYHGSDPSDDDSFTPATCGNRRCVALASFAGDLIGSGIDTNNMADIFVWEREPASGAFMRRVSLDSNENQTTTGASFGPSITFDGRFVAFQSAATDFVDGDDNEVIDIFVRDRNGNENLIFDEPDDSLTFRVSLTTLGAGANEHSSSPSISANDGRFIAFSSLADNLLGDCDPGVSGDCNNHKDVFVRDTDPPGSTFRVSVSTTGVEGDGTSSAPSISGNGRFVAFESVATTLIGACVPGISGDCNGHKDIFVRDTAEPPLTFRISDPAGAEEANGASFAPAISADGRFVAFSSYDTAIVDIAGRAAGSLSDAKVDDFTVVP